MSLQLILGTSGSGKSTYLNDYLIKESMAHLDQNYMILVPEQFTMETQMKITGAHPCHGTMNIDVLSFVRLAHKVFGLAGCTDYVVLDDMGKCVILQKAALKQQSKLQVFGRNLKKPGFVNELKSMLSELYQYGITPEQLENACGQVQGNPILKGKLQDMIQIYRGFQQELDEVVITAEELLPKMCEYLPSCGILEGLTIGLDGYTGFTPVQYQVLQVLLQYGARVMVTVTIDPRIDCSKNIPEHELFYLSCQTVRRLTELAGELDIPLEKSVCLMEGLRFNEAPALGFLESHYLRSDLMQDQFVTETLEENTEEKLSENTAVQVKVCQSPAEEVELICEEICQLVIEQGLRYREIVVITGNPEAYNPLISRRLERLGIPCFVDQKKHLSDHPLAQYLTGLQQIVIHDFAQDKVFQFLKCGLGVVHEDDVNQLENYVMATGIKGHKKWAEPWFREKRSGEFTDFQEINRIRELVGLPLLRFYEAWKEKDLTVSARQKILRAYLEDQKICDQLTSYAEVFEDREMTIQASAYRQAFELMMNLLDEIDKLLGETVMSPKDYLACLESGIEEIKVGSIPLLADRLIVGDMQRTRLSDIKVLFFAGVNEGQVPAARSGGGIFSDFDKEQLLKQEIELSPTTRMNSFMDRFYLYLALTRPSEELRISYTKTDSAGKGLRPSSCIPDLLHMFPGLSIRDASETGLYAERIHSRSGLWQYMIAQMKDVKQAVKIENWKLIFSYFSQENPEEIEPLLKAMADGYKEESLSGKLTKLLYGEILNASVSRLETQAACAFAHFVQYGLSLRERETFSFAATDMGTLFHEALDQYFKRAKQENLAIAEIEEGKRTELVEECVAAAISKTKNHILEDNARNRYLANRLTKITDRTVWSLTEQLKQTGYVTDGSEVIFDSGNTEAFAIPLNEEWKMALRGRIDRIDTKTDGDKLYVRIVDYKSGSKKFDLVSVYYGQQIQLVFYMEAAKELFKRERAAGQEILPGGVLYYNISDPIVQKEKGMEAEDIQAAILKELMMNGMITKDSCGTEEWEMREPKGRTKKPTPVELVEQDQFAQVEAHVHKLVRELGSQIVSGKISVNPYMQGKSNPCAWCSYQSICGFDKKRRGYHFRNLNKVNKKNVWEVLQAELEEGGEA